MPTVKISETYDLSTQVDKMGIIGVHTPDLYTVNKLYPGLFENYKYYTLDGCDVALVCASVLPADPSQIGTDAGEIAPQDMLNPILYKAVSNESFDTFNARLKTLSDVQSLGSVAQSDEAFANSAYPLHNDWNIYYGLLSEPHGFLKAMPQNGLTMRGLYPMMFPLLTTSGNERSYPSDTYTLILNDAQVSQEGGINLNYNNGFMKGPGQRMPRLPTHIPKANGNVNEGPLGIGGHGRPPKTFVGMIITPPAKLHKLFYRMRVTWTITFHELTPVSMFDLEALSIAGAYNYEAGYNFASAKTSLDEKTNMVDATNTDVDLIMTSGK